MASLAHGPGRRLLLAPLLLLFAAGVARAATCDRPLRPPAPDTGIHAPWDGLVRSFVDHGEVDYACMKAHEGQLDRYLGLLARIRPERLSREAQLALWIDAYNAFTVKLILGRYPGIRSIKEIPRRWKRRDWRVGGRRYSLDEIENDILRARFHEPRIHFAINCASKSCPDLASEAYVAPRLEAQLDAAARRFLADPRKGARVAPGRGLFGRGDRLYLSAIFKWFGEDFTRAGGLAPFLLTYLPEGPRAFVARHRSDLPVSYLPYDWSLNGR